MGRKQIQIDYDKVRKLAGDGLTEDEIALSLGISTSTLTRRKSDSEHFGRAIKEGRAAAAGTVANALMELVKRKNLGAIVWYEKTRRGLSDRLSVDVDWREQAQKDGIPADTISDVFEEMVSKFANQLQNKEVAGDSGSGDADV